jgi:hypothetical protein
MANPTPASQWNTSSNREELELPSGNVCLIKRPGIEKLFTAGVLPDELSKIALKAIADAQAPGKPRDHLPAGGVKEDDLDPELMTKFLEGEGALEDLFSSFDKVTSYCVVEPKCQWHMRKVLDAHGDHLVDSKGRPQYEEIPESERDENVLYTDKVDMDDKAFIFNFVVGGTRDIERFREESGDDVAVVQPRENVEQPPI